eukprot:TRINITY_DN5425_c0_g1_i1.p1 TRINITY_DN5425_c0_g1~~TRINITY_DN5425_c0_g1_i1.p1  ORF type:complete len:872 (-),score=76.87 TRINITY_DN5425_c0_g1_i1:121-2736(-)
MDSVVYRQWEESNVESGALRLIAASLLKYSTSPISSLVNLTVISRWLRDSTVEWGLWERLWISPFDVNPQSPFLKSQLRESLLPRAQYIRSLSFAGCDTPHPIAIRPLLASLPNLLHLALPSTAWEIGEATESHLSLKSVDLSGSDADSAHLAVTQLLHHTPYLRRLVVSEISPINNDAISAFVWTCRSVCPLISVISLGYGSPALPLQLDAVDALTVSDTIEVFLRPELVVSLSCVDGGFVVKPVPCWAPSLDARRLHETLDLFPRIFDCDSGDWNLPVKGLRPMTLLFTWEQTLAYSCARRFIELGASPFLNLLPSDRMSSGLALESLPPLHLSHLAQHLRLPPDTSHLRLSEYLSGTSAFSLAVGCGDWDIVSLFLDCDRRRVSLFDQCLAGCHLIASLPCQLEMITSFFRNLAAMESLDLDVLRLALLYFENPQVWQGENDIQAAQNILEMLFSSGHTPRSEPRSDHLSVTHPTGLWKEPGLPHLFYTSRTALWQTLVASGADLNGVDCATTKRTLLHWRIAAHDVAAVYFLLNNQASVDPSFDPVTVLIESLNPHDDEAHNAAKILSILMQEGIRPRQKLSLEDVLALKSCAIFDVLLKQDWISMPVMLQPSPQGESGRRLPAQLMVLIASCFNISDDFMYTIWSGLGLSRGFLSDALDPSEQSLHTASMLADSSNLLHVAAIVCWRKSIFRFLIKQCAIPPNQRNSRQETPFLLACRASNMDAVKAIVYYVSKQMEGSAAVPNTPGQGDRLPAHLPRLPELGEAKSVLFAQCDQDGNSGLHLAVSSLSYSIVEFLCSEGFPIDSVNNDGKTPIDLCVASAAADEALFETNTGMLNLLAAHHKLQKGTMPSIHHLAHGHHHRCAII